MHVPTSLVVCLTLTAIASAPTTARAKEPGSLWLGGAIGPSFKVGSRLGGSGGNLSLAGQAEYTLDPKVSVIAGLTLGLAGTVPLQLRAGGRYRVSISKMPIRPYGQAELVVGRLFDVIGANLTVYGLRLGGGADFMLRPQVAVGGLVAYQLARTVSDRPTVFGSFELFATASMRF